MYKNNNNDSMCSNDTNGILCASFPPVWKTYLCVFYFPLCNGGPHRCSGGGRVCAAVLNIQAVEERGTNTRHGMVNVRSILIRVPARSREPRRVSSSRRLIFGGEINTVHKLYPGRCTNIGLFNRRTSVHTKLLACRGGVYMRGPMQ